jgi:hypothetical protein
VEPVQFTALVRGAQAAIELPWNRFREDRRGLYHLQHLLSIGAHLARLNGHGGAGRRRGIEVSSPVPFEQAFEYGDSVFRRSALKWILTSARASASRK